MGQQLFGAGAGGSGGLFFLLLVDQLHGHAKGDEDAEGDDEEVDDVHDEDAIVDGDLLDGLDAGSGGGALLDDILHVLEALVAGENGDEGHDDVIDQRADNFAESAADDDTDGHVYHIALEGESFEIFNKRHKIIGVIGPVCQRVALGVGTGEVGLVNCRYRGHVAATRRPGRAKRA